MHRNKKRTNKRKYRKKSVKRYSKSKRTLKKQLKNKSIQRKNKSIKRKKKSIKRKNSKKQRGGLDDKKTCAICHVDFETGVMVTTLECGHRFHTDCLLEMVGMVGQSVGQGEFGDGGGGQKTLDANFLRCPLCRVVRFTKGYLNMNSYEFVPPRAEAEPARGAAGGGSASSLSSLWGHQDQQISDEATDFNIIRVDLIGSVWNVEERTIFYKFEVTFQNISDTGSPIVFKIVILRRYSELLAFHKTTAAAVRTPNFPPKGGIMGRPIPKDRYEKLVNYYQTIRDIPEISRIYSSRDSCFLVKGETEIEEFERNKGSAIRERQEEETRQAEAEAEARRVAEARTVAEEEADRQALLVAIEAEHEESRAEAERLRQEAESERQRQEAEAERQRQAATEAERLRQKAEAERQRQEAEAEAERRRQVAAKAAKAAESDHFMFGRGRGEPRWMKEMIAGSDAGGGVASMKREVPLEYDTEENLYLLLEQYQIPDVRTPVEKGRLQFPSDILLFTPDQIFGGYLEDFKRKQYGALTSQIKSNAVNLILGVRKQAGLTDGAETQGARRQRADPAQGVLRQRGIGGGGGMPPPPPPGKPVPRPVRRRDPGGGGGRGGGGGGDGGGVAPPSPAELIGTDVLIHSKTSGTEHWGVVDSVDEHGSFQILYFVRGKQRSKVVSQDELMKLLSR